jgi:inner membrane protein
VITKVDLGKRGIKMVEHTEKYFFLPETLVITGEVNPTVLHRGIFDAVVYESALQLNAVFSKPNFKALNIDENLVLWNAAHMIFAITDLRGIRENPNFTVGNLASSTEPSSDLGIVVENSVNELQAPTTRYVEDADGNSKFSSNGILAKLNWSSADNFQGNTSIKLNLKGSKNLSFIPIGKTTTVTLKGRWGNPSFDGEFLPETREVTDTTFKASWKVLHYNRPFAQQWNTAGKQLSSSEFGVRLLVPVDQYQKSIRTAKYGQLIIILTFVALFLVEITKSIRIHPFQYILVGAALIIYYCLLLSLSEQLGYNTAYWIATAATVCLVSFYSVSFLKNYGLVILLTTLLAIFYTFIFVIILQQDLSLLLGSIGLFIIIAALMFFSRKVSWYKEDVPPIN